MKIVIRTTVALAAAVLYLSAATTFAAGPAMGSRYGYPIQRYSNPGARYAANPNASSRVSTTRTAQTPADPQAEPQAAPPVVDAEPIAAPAPMVDGPMQEYSDQGMWDGNYGDGGACCDDVYCGTCRPGMWYFSADYLLVRPRLSQGVAEYRQTQEVIVNGTQTEVNSIDTSRNYCFDYNSSFRIALGYRWLECGGDFQFSYWRLTGNADVFDGPTSLQDNRLTILGQLGNDTSGSGQFFQAHTGVTANIYDIDFLKCMALGGPSSPCQCDFCPRWDLKWLAGIRIGDVSRFNNNAVTEDNGDIVSFGNIDSRFTGAGPRVGVQGRRYFGQCGMLSVFAKGSQALLIGDYDLNRVLNNVGQETPSITSQFDSFCRMIPVTDIEIGATWQCSCYAYFSIGWFWQAWWDLGQSEIIGSSNFGPLDTTNLLSFDGLFVRGELLF